MGRIAIAGALAISIAFAAVALTHRLTGLPEGLRAEYFRTNDWASTPALSIETSPPSTSGMLAAWDGRLPAQFSAAWSGSLLVARTADYTIATTSDDGSWVYVDGALVVDNGGNHAATLRTGTVRLTRGVHAIYVRYFQGGGAAEMALLWARAPDAREGLRTIPLTRLTPARPKFSRFLFSSIVAALEPALYWAWLAASGIVILLIPSFSSRKQADVPSGERVNGRDLAAAGLAACVAMTIYVATLAPGLVQDIDAPMFQFIGRVLGVPHNPGYPVYVMITSLFARIPIGSLAYRINLFSALMGATSAALVVVICRQLGCRRVVALGTGLAFAFGRVYWSQAVIAEVYTMNTAIITGMFASLLAWYRSRQPGWFFIGMALFAIGLAHHTDILGFLPGIAIFGLFVDRRFVTKPRTLALVAVLLLCALSLYLVIIVRTKQGAYVESPAATLTDLSRVVLGAQFADRLFTSGWSTPIVDVLPQLTRQVMIPELSLPGAVLSILGIGVLVRRAPSVAVLLLGGCLAIVGFVVNYRVPDPHVFLIPAMLVLWICAALGVEHIAQTAGGRIAGVEVATAIVCLMLPVWQLTHNFAVNNHRSDTFLDAHFDRVFAALPSRSFIVKQDVILDRMVNYKLLGEDAGRGRELVFAPAGTDNRRIRDYLTQGFAVFAFRPTATRLKAAGFDVEPFVSAGGEADQLTVFRVRAE